MAAKKQPVKQEEVKRPRQQAVVRIPKQVSASTDKVWRRAMIKAIQDQARMTKHRASGFKDKGDD